MNNVVARGVLVDMDALLDTRLPILLSIDPSITEKLAIDKNYIGRKKDAFLHIPNSVFNAVYKNRGKNVLTYATPTLMHDQLNNVLISLRSDASTAPDAAQTIYINYYPYDLTDDEINIYLQTYATIYPDFDIEMVSMSIPELTTMWVNENVSYIIKYDGIKWMEYQVAVGNAATTPIPHVELIFPAIVDDRFPSKEVSKAFFEKWILGLITVVYAVPAVARYFSSTAISTTKE